MTQSLQLPRSPGHRKKKITKDLLIIKILTKAITYFEKKSIYLHIYIYLYLIFSFGKVHLDVQINNNSLPNPRHSMGFLIQTPLDSSFVVGQSIASSSNKDPREQGPPGSGNFVAR